MVETPKGVYHTTEKQMSNQIAWIVAEISQEASKPRGVYLEPKNIARDYPAYDADNPLVYQYITLGPLVFTVTPVGVKD